MTAPLRLLAITFGLLLALAPAASATTTPTYDGPTKTVTLTNDGSDGETFTIVLDAAASPKTYKVTATNAVFSAPPMASKCELTDGGKTITCTSTDVTEIVINGAAGDDTFTVSGFAGFQSGTPGLALNGDAGNDTFTAGAGSALGSTVKGGEGNDSFVGSAELGDTFYTEAGDDTYRGGTAVVPAGSDPELYQRERASDTFRTAQEEAIRRRAEELPINVSLDGVRNDIDGKGGTDDVDGIEYLSGGTANDVLTAGAGASSILLVGGAGDDTLTGSPAGDQLYGETGSDTIRGLAGDDEIYDGDFDAVSRAASDPVPATGNDVIDGGEGEDAITYGAGKDDVAGGPGVDWVYFSRIDTIVFDAPPATTPKARFSALTISLDDVANDGAAGEGDNLHSDVENLDTSGGLGSVARSNRIAFGPGNSDAPDTITGSAAANFIRTGAGNDSVDAGGGADFVDVGPGDDQVNAVDKVTDIIRCGRGTDNVGADLPGTNAARADALSDCENVTGTPLGLEGGVLPTLPALPVAPKVKLGGASSYKVQKFLRNYTVTNTVTVDQAATVSGELTLTGAKIAKVGALTIGSGRLKSGTGTRKLKIKVAVKYRKALKRKLKGKKRRKKGVKLSLVVTTRNASGQSTVSRRTIRVRR